MRYNGKITEWNDERGFGFVTVAGTEARHFMHVSAFQGRGRRPVIGDQVTFELKAQDGRRGPAAVAIRLTGTSAPPATAGRRFAIDWTIALLQLVSLAVALAAARVPAWVALLVLAGSLVAFVIYNIDKRRAEQGMSDARVSEAALLQISFIGWLGALAAQQLFRHKSAKREFYIPFRLVGLAQVLVFGWFAFGKGLAL